MGIYARHVLPWIVDRVCGSKPVRLQRAKIVPRARGEVLEIGFGSGLNLPFYDPSRVTRVRGVDPVARGWSLAAGRVRASAVPVDFVEAGAEAIPVPDESFDTVLVTYTLCTITDVVAALGEMRRTLREGGELLFCEHGRSPDARVRRTQERITPLWKRIGGGCHLDRDVPALLVAGGFVIEEMDTMYIPGWKPASFNFWGCARPRPE